MNTEARELLGITDEIKTPTTHLAWLLDLVKNHGEPGLKYAVGLKINHALQRDTYAEFCGVSDDPEKGFRFLVEEILSWKNAMSDALRSLLKSEYAWSLRYIKDLVNLPVGEIPVRRLPELPRRLNLRLAGDFAGAGLPYAIRMFTVPVVVGDSVPCERQAYWFRDFAEQIMCRGDWLSVLFTDEMKKPEFAPFAHLISLGSSSTSSGAGPILTITSGTTPSGTIPSMTTT